MKTLLQFGLVFEFHFSDNVWSVLEKTEFIDTYGDNMYMTVEDAVTAARLAAPAEEV